MENEGISIPDERRFEGAGLILLFDGEVGTRRYPDERWQADILTPGLEPRSRLPSNEASGDGSL